jgi:hypothetical protein
MNKDLNKIALTKEDRIEAYKYILGDDEEYTNSFFKGYKPNYYFNTESEELNESQIKDILAKAILTGKNKFASCTSMSKPITLDDLDKLAEKLNQLPPVANKIEIGTFALKVLLEKIPTIDNTKFKSYPNTMYGLPIEIYEGYDFKFNQMRVKFSNGESKIIDVFTCNDNVNIYNEIFRMESENNE